MYRLISYCFIITFCFIFNIRQGFAQDSASVNILNATIQSKFIEIDLSNPQEVELALKKIHTFRYIESIILQGEGQDADLKKLLYRFSVLKNLNQLTFEDNNISTISENISGLKTLTSLTIQGNESLDYNDFCEKIKTLPLQELHFIDNSWIKPPAGISKINSLKKLEVSGSPQLNHEELIEQLAGLPQLTTLAIPVNFMPDLPKNITKLRYLKVLDVSNNVLTELPSEISSLKAINNLSIQGNLLINPVKDLEKLKDAPIQYLSLDKEISGEEVEQIKKMFPNAEISFPLSEDAEEEITKEKENKPEITVSTGNLNASKEVTVLSMAYLSYPALFRGIRYNFDTLLFEERYSDFKYANKFQLVNPQLYADGQFYFQTSKSGIQPPKKETYFFLPDQITFPELKAFNSMYWVYVGPLSKKEFKRKYLLKRQKYRNQKNKQKKTLFPGPTPWKDIRILYDKNNSLFVFEMKGDTAFEKFTAYPVSPSVSLEKNQQTYTRRFVAYEKALLRRTKNFNRDLVKEKYKYDLTYRQLQQNAWKALQIRMSNEERLLSQEEWLNYYDKLIADEFSILRKSALNKEFVQRALSLKNYTTNQIFIAQNSSLVTINNNSRLSANFINKNGKGKLAVASFFIIDNRTKRLLQYTGSLGVTPETLFLKQFASNTIIVELRNGDFGVVSSKQIDTLKILPDQTYDLEVTVFDKNLDTIETLLKAAETH